MNRNSNSSRYRSRCFLLIRWLPVSPTLARGPDSNDAAKSPVSKNAGKCAILASATTNKQPQNSQHNRTAHLKRFRWEPGQSGDPNGTPRGPSFHGRIAAILERCPSATLERITEDDLHRIVRQVIGHAVDGDIRCARIILDRIWPVPSSRRRSCKRDTPISVDPVGERFDRIAAAVMGGLGAE